MRLTDSKNKQDVLKQGEKGGGGLDSILIE